MAVNHRQFAKAKTAIKKFADQDSQHDPNAGRKTSTILTKNKFAKECKHSDDRQLDRKDESTQAAQMLADNVQRPALRVNRGEHGLKQIAYFLRDDA